MNKIKNLVAAVYAPMKNDRSLNLEVIPSYQKFLMNNKVSGAFINGTTGDFASLTVDERKSILDTWYKNKVNDFKLINSLYRLPP
jgi:N-acetylneuraminate lyase